MEVINVLGRYGIVPMGRRAESERRLGFCKGSNAGDYGSRLGRGVGRGEGLDLGLGRSCGCRNGFGRFLAGEITGAAEKKLLSEQNELLQNRLDIVSKQLGKLSASSEVN